MAAYPALPQMEGSELQPLFDTRIDRAVSGTPKLRSFYDATKYQFRLVHWLTPAQLVTLLAHYEGGSPANKTSPNTLTWNATGATYSVYFAGPPRQSWQEGRYVVEVDLVQA